MSPVAVAGEVTYAFDPEAIRFEPSRILTPDTYVAFEGATAYGERSKIPFRVTSRNWQESDRFLAGIMTAFGAPTRAIQIDGVGKFAACCSARSAGRASKAASPAGRCAPGT